MRGGGGGGANEGKKPTWKDRTLKKDKDPAQRTLGCAWGGKKWSSQLAWDRNTQENIFLQNEKKASTA